MRELHLGSTGLDVKALQRALNDRAQERGMPIIKVDGDVGPATLASADRVCRALGALEYTLQQDPVTIGMQRMVLSPGKRTPVQLKRARDRKAHAVAAEKAEAARTVKVVKNKATGGTAAERRVALAEKALELDLAGVRKSFYSQPGKFTVDHTVTGEKPGERSDCSQHVTGIHWGAGNADPNDEDFKAGYTGTLAANMREIDHAIDGCTVIWDPWGPQGHTATVTDAKRGQCIGHGSKHVARHAISDFSYKGRARFYVPAGA